MQKKKKCKWNNVVTSVTISIKRVEDNSMWNPTDTPTKCKQIYQKLPIYATNPWVECDEYRDITDWVKKFISLIIHIIESHVTVDVLGNIKILW